MRVRRNHSRSLFAIVVALLTGISTLTTQQDVIGMSYESSGNRIGAALGVREMSPGNSGNLESGLIMQNDTSGDRETTSTGVDTNGINDPRNAPIKDGNPSVMSLGGDFSTQAALIGPATFRSTDLVSSTAIYEIQFITTTTGVIDKINIAFPAGTVVTFAGIIERIGIGPGALTKSGSTVTLDLHTPVSIPAGTLIRLEMVDLINPPNPANYKISVTTRDPSNTPIDGPSLSPAYTIRQVSTGMIADGAITNPKIASEAVTTPKIAISAVDNAAIQTNAVSNSKLGPGSVSNSKLGTGSVTSDKVATGTFGLPAAQRPGTAVNLPFNVITAALADCLPGEQVIAGGFFVSADNENDFRIVSEFIVGNSWQVLGNNAGGGAMTLQAFAVCALDFPL